MSMNLSLQVTKIDLSRRQKMCTLHEYRNPCRLKLGNYGFARFNGDSLEVKSELAVEELETQIRRGQLK
jgi:hypothetical protein